MEFLTLTLTATNIMLGIALFVVSMHRLDRRHIARQREEDARRGGLKGRD